MPVVDDLLVAFLRFGDTDDAQAKLLQLVSEHESRSKLGPCSLGDYPYPLLSAAESVAYTSAHVNVFKHRVHGLEQRLLQRKEALPNRIVRWQIEFLIALEAFMHVRFFWQTMLDSTG